MITTDTEKTYFLHEALDMASFQELSTDELKIVKRHVEITRHLQEIHHLYLMFKFNLDGLQRDYDLKFSGNVFNHEGPAIREKDYIAINTYVNNIISAGRTLVESMECYMATHYNDGDLVKDQYMDFYHGIYDHSFAYRLLIRLRDYSQHGHLPVCADQNNYYFDLKQILDKPHYNHNKTFALQMREITEEIVDTYGTMPTFSLTVTLAEFVAKLLSIYRFFWKLVKSMLVASYEHFQIIVKAYPKNIVKNSKPLVRLFIYDIEDNYAQAVCIDDKPLIMLNKFQKEAIEVLKEYQDAWKELCKGSLKIRVVDKERIEIDEF